MDVDTSQLEQWFSQNFLIILIVGGFLVLLYAYSGRFVRKVVRRTLKATDQDFSGSGVEDAELDKRATTIESLATSLIRLAVISVGVFFIVGLTGAWNVLLVIGLFFAGIAVAGQAIVMDYLMGILILLEGQFFQGDNIELGNLPWKGTVESVGLRRTVVRAVDGTVYSISNAELRTVANRTRIYAAAEVRVRGIRDGDMRRVVAIMEQVGQDVTNDPDFAEVIIEAPKLKFVDEADELGGIAVLRGKVVAGERWRVATELRLRLDDELSAAGIELNRRAIAGALFGGQRTVG
jgi:small conductance mechanosensitive channel